MSDREKEILATVIRCILKLSDEVAVNADDQCMLYEMLGELEE